MFSPGARRLVAPLLPALMFTCLALGPLWPVFMGHSFSVVPSFQTATYPWAGLPSELEFTWPQSDQAESAFPYSAFVGRSLRDGTLPLWEPHSFGGGYPIFSNGIVGVLYPPNLLLRGLFSPEQAHDLLITVHLAAAGLFTYLLLRRSRVGVAGAAVAGITWMFGSFPMAWLQLDMVTPVFALLPLGLYAVDRALRPGSWGWAVAAGWLLAITLTAGNLLFMWMAYVTAGLYGALLVLSSVATSRRTGAGFPLAQLGRLIVIGGVSVAGAAVTLLPTALALSAGGRTPFSYEQLSSGLLMPLDTLQRVLQPPPLPVTAEWMHQMAWYGTIPAVLAVVGLFLARSRTAWLGRVSTIGGVAVAVGTPLTWVVYHGVPGMDALRPYSRLLLIIGFGLVVLAGSGLDLFERAIRSRLLTLRPGDPVFRRRMPVALSVGLVVLTGGMAWWQLVPYGLAINPPLLADHAHPQFPRTPIVDAIETADAENPWPSRLLQVAVTRTDGAWSPAPLVGATPLVFGLDSFGGYDSVVPERTTTMVRLLEGVPLEEALGPAGFGYLAHPVFASTEVPWELIERYGVELVYAPPPFGDGDPGDWGTARPDAWELRYDGPDGRLYRIPTADSSPYVVPTQHVARDGADALATFTGPAHDARSTVVLERDDLEAADLPLLPAGDLQPRALRADRHGNQIHVRAVVNRPGWLVLPANWDRGWSAKVNNAAVPVLRADFSRMAVPLPAGASSVVLRYRPPGFILGMVLSAVTALLCAVLLVLTRRSGAAAVS